MCLAQMVVHFHWCNCLIEKGCQNIETKWLMQEGTPKERLTAVTYKLTRTVHLVIVSLSCLALGMVHFRAFVTFPLRAIKKKGCQNLTRVHQKKMSPRRYSLSFSRLLLLLCLRWRGRRTRRCSQTCQFLRIKEMSKS